MQKWLPDLAAPIREVTTSLIEAMLSHQPWVWNETQYIGSVHGEIGIVTQIVLSDPSYAHKVEAKLSSLLNLQVGKVSHYISLQAYNYSDGRRQGIDVQILGTARTIDHKFGLLTK